MKRREILKGLSLIPLSGNLFNFKLTNSSSLPGGQSAHSKSIYETVGVRPVINARGTVTIVGGSRVWPEVAEVMNKATEHFVQIDELMDKVGDRLAQLTGAEWGCITSGASAAGTAATAACVTGGDPDKAWMIPNLQGLKDEVIIPNYSRTAYDAAAKAVGVQMVEVSSKEELLNAIGAKTAMVLVLAGEESENGPLSISAIAEHTKSKRIPIFVDAAAEGLEVPNPHIVQGADLVAYSGGKYLRGPQCAGLLIGRKDLIRAARVCMAPHHGFGRGFKVGREEILGMLKAVEVWLQQDHRAIFDTWEKRLKFIQQELNSISYLKTTIDLPTGRSNRSPSLLIEWDRTQFPKAGYELEQLLWNYTPRIAVSGAGSFLPFPPNEQPNISVNSSQLSDAEAKLVAKALVELFSSPPKADKKSLEPAKTDLSGQWDLTMHFAAATEKQILVFEQKKNQLTGTHFASRGERALIGEIDGERLLFRSSYTLEGVRLNFEFIGTILNEKQITGEVNLGEYGSASWEAIKK